MFEKIPKIVQTTSYEVVTDDEGHPPYEDPRAFLAFLREYHDPNCDFSVKGAKRREPYDYDSLGVTEEMIPCAIAWAEKKGINPIKLSPAQIIGAYYDATHSEQPSAEDLIRASEEEMRRWRSNLEKNRASLEGILNGHIRTFIHATGRFGGENSVASILKHGLVVGPGTIQTTAKALERLYLLGTETKETASAMQEEVVQKNMDSMASPHKGNQGNTWQMIIQLPERNDAQKADMLHRRAAGEYGIDGTEYFITETDKGDFRLDSKYIIGYVDLETGIFHPKK